MLVRINRVILVVTFLVCASCGYYYPQNAKSCRTQKEFIEMIHQPIRQVNDLEKLFPKTVDQMVNYVAWVKEYARNEIAEILALSPSQRTFANTIKRLDATQSSVVTIYCLGEALELVSPDATLREAANKAQADLKAFMVEEFMAKPVYNAVQEYVVEFGQQEERSATQEYYLQELLKDYKREGLLLPDDEYEAVKELKKLETELDLQFGAAIALDNKTIAVPEEDLTGIDGAFIKSLKRDDAGLVILGTDTPTFTEVMSHCSNASVREKMHCLYNNRAYPENYATLSKLIDVRDQLAQALGFDSFASLSLDSAMAKNVGRVDQFLTSLLKKAKLKEQQEFEELVDHLPDDVSLSPEGKMYPWDRAYVKELYKKSTYQLDDREVAEYFPADKVIQSVFDIYQKFLSLSFTLVQAPWKWHEDVTLIEVKDKDTDRLRGYIYLDLYPRENKYTHACHATIVHTTKQVDAHTGAEIINPSVALVVANFPRAIGDKPALLKFRDSETFLHEFGHAMHGLLGSTEMAGASGTSVKHDFVEMPSQMFEEWMYDRSVLKSMSAHYKTGLPLPDHVIDTILTLKKFDTGYFIVRQCWLAALSLNLYKAGQNKDIDAINKRIFNRYIDNAEFDERVHFAASFGHLGGYDARYYCYLWSKVFALDIFAKIKEEGVLDQAVGTRFKDAILAQGGSLDPDILLHNFLGRAPQEDAFFDDLGI